MITPELFKLNGKIAVVTGGYGKVGRQIVQAFVESGCRVIVASRNPHKVNFEKYQGMVDFKKCNVAVKKDVSRLRDYVLSRYGKIDILVNCVSGNNLSSLEGMSLKNWEKTLEGGLNPSFLCTQIIGSAMKKQKYGNIINIGSIYGLVAPDQRIYGDSGLNSSIAYATLKSAILNFTRYVAVYWAKYGIRCNTLTLGGLKDPSNNNEYFRKNYINKTPMGRMMEKDDIKGAAIFLASDASRYYTGQNLVLDGGWTAW